MDLAGFRGGESRTGGALPPTRINKKIVILVAYITSNSSSKKGSLFFHLRATSREFEEELGLNEAQMKGLGKDWEGRAPRSSSFLPAPPRAPPCLRGT